MKKIVYWILAMSVVIILLPQCQWKSKSNVAKYVFYFIGDGMGVNQVNGAEMYREELAGRIGVNPLNFSQFPVVSMASTFSRYNSVTCSAAAGTALATGEKTKNGVLGLDSLVQTPLFSVAVKAKEWGKKVGIATSVSIDHATPAAFYAHQPKRSMYYEIATDLPKTGFDFYAGSGFLRPEGKDGQAGIFDLLKDSGYYVAKGVEEFRSLPAAARKVVLMQKDGSAEALPYAIDSKAGDLTLEQITDSAIRFLEKDADKGFFLMVEGGKIDFACHNNDAATVFCEIMDFEKAIQRALDFYTRHPDETLIVVTADHETGGIVLGRGRYELNLDVLKYQKASEENITEQVKQLRKEKNNKVAWEDVQELLTRNFGFWKSVDLSVQQETTLKETYKETFRGSKVEMEKSLYASNEPIVAKAVKILNDIAMVGWTSGGHSAGYVPVYAIGAGAGYFRGKLDNTDIPKRIEMAMSGKKKFFR